MVKGRSQRKSQLTLPIFSSHLRSVIWIAMRLMQKIRLMSARPLLIAILILQIQMVLLISIAIIWLLQQMEMQVISFQFIMKVLAPDKLVLMAASLLMAA